MDILLIKILSVGILVFLIGCDDSIILDKDETPYVTYKIDNVIKVTEINRETYKINYIDQATKDIKSKTLHSQYRYGIRIEYTNNETMYVTAIEQGGYKKYVIYMHYIK